MLNKTQIPITQGFVAIISACDYELVSRFRWRILKTGATNYAQSGGGHGKESILMHRLILGHCVDGKVCDHRDGNGLNNKRSNLRPATHAQNIANSKRRIATSKYRGVSWCKDRNKWMANIFINGKTVNLGRYSTELQAWAAYLKAAKKRYGQFVYGT